MDNGNHNNRKTVNSHTKTEHSEHKRTHSVISHSKLDNFHYVVLSFKLLFDLENRSMSPKLVRNV